MPLFQKISDDMKAAMKSGDKARLEVLHFVLAGLQAALKDKQMKDPSATLTDEETTLILQKEVKRRRESIELFKQGNRADLADAETAQLTFITPYLPAQMSREEIEKMVDELKAQGLTEFSALMREASQKTKGRADGKLIAEIVKAKLGN